MPGLSSPVWVQLKDALFQLNTDAQNGVKWIITVTESSVKYAHAQ